MHQITIGNIEIDIVKKDIKNLHLSVYPPTGRVHISSPLELNDETIKLFAISKIPWIKKHQKNFNKQERQTTREYVSGESHYYFGHRYLLNVIYHDRMPRVLVRNKKYIDLYVRFESDRNKREEVLKEWYRKNLKEKIDELITKWQPIIHVETNEWGVKRMRTKWGTCNTETKKIWINLELCKKPISCLEYILVHELVHLHERLHNERFIAYMDKFLPNWRLRKDQLNNLPISHPDWEY